MYLCIANRQQIENASASFHKYAFKHFKEIETHNLWPHEIRELVERLYSEVDFHTIYYSVNRTVLDMVGPRDNHVIDYDNVFVIADNKLEYLTDYIDPDYLVHFALGDLLERNELNFDTNQA